LETLKCQKKVNATRYLKLNARQLLPKQKRVKPKPEHAKLRQKLENRQYAGPPHSDII